MGKNHLYENFGKKDPKLKRIALDMRTILIITKVSVVNGTAVSSNSKALVMHSFLIF